MLTIAGIGVDFPGRAKLRVLRERLPARYPWCRVAHPTGSNGLRLGARPLWPIDDTIEPGRFTWPTGASRWAFGHFCMISEQIRRMMAIANLSTTSTVGPVTLTMRTEFDLPVPATGDTLTGLSTPIFILPPQPLLRVPRDPAVYELDPAPPRAMAEQALYLVTVVDVRYFWRSILTNNAYAAIPSWGTLLGQIATDLGLPALGLTVPTPATGELFGTPDASLLASGLPVPAVLDAAAACLGGRIVRAYDGTVKLVTWPDGWTLDAADRTTNSVRLPYGGGTRDFPDPEL